MHLYDEPSAVQCPECGRWWKPGNEACAVVHLGQGCCHYGDTEVLAPEDGGTGTVSLSVAVSGARVMTDREISAVTEKIWRALGGEGGMHVA